jgi:hypothetical protein
MKHGPGAAASWSGGVKSRCRRLHAPAGERSRAVHRRVRRFPAADDPTSHGSRTPRSGATVSIILKTLRMCNY